MNTARKYLAKVYKVKTGNTINPAALSRMNDREINTMISSLNR
jgi:hypothetical protein